MVVARCGTGSSGDVSSGFTKMMPWKETDEWKHCTLERSVLIHHIVVHRVIKIQDMLFCWKIRILVNIHCG